jgi:hypothetical protein
MSLTHQQNAHTNKIHVLIITFSPKCSGTAAATSTNKNIPKTILQDF